MAEKLNKIKKEGPKVEGNKTSIETIAQPWNQEACC